jgi:kynurenine--oxoglutarate transaminase/cysteine-S-conjugate beta-lyase/glutamine--phenylpyruvate transaminase
LIQKAEQTVWNVFGELAMRTKSTNLGQGFPDWEPAPFVLKAMVDVMTMPSMVHQYTRPAGYPLLVKLLADRYSRHLNREVDDLNEVAVTVGASQALYLALTTLLSKGDEVVMFEPFFDLYIKQIALTGATTRFVQLGGAKASLADPWALDIEALRAQITPKTKVLILNSPHNPTGKVFSLEEMEAIAEVVRENPGLLVISDEVYKFTVYDAVDPGDESVVGHRHFARLPDMWERTLTLSSCGKTFSVTGWQVGWMVGPSSLVKPIQDLLPAVQFCAATPMQHALTNALAAADEPYNGYSNFYEWQRNSFPPKKALLEQGLLAAGLEPMPAQGGFFMMARVPRDAETRRLFDPRYAHEALDWQYSRMLGERYGVVGIPTSTFFSPESTSEDTQGYVRFTFCKKDETLLEAVDRLSKIRSGG